VLEDRFLQLSLKEVPFKKAPAVEEEEAEAFFGVGSQLLDMRAKRRGEVKREDLTKGKFKEFEDLHVTKDPYKYEVSKGCWRRALLALCAQYPDGEPPPGAVEALYCTDVCPFGCPPPKLPWRVFVDMKKVPRPRLSGGTQYDSFGDCYGQDTPLVLPPLDNGAVVELAPAGILVKAKGRGRIGCSLCCVLRVVYVDKDPKRVDMDSPESLRRARRRAQRKRGHVHVRQRPRPRRPRVPGQGAALRAPQAELQLAPRAGPLDRPRRAHGS